MTLNGGIPITVQATKTMVTTAMFMVI
jgi:hypothetical protein